MVNKRLMKYNAVTHDIIPPVHAGSNNYKYVVVSWGSNRQTVEEALSVIGRNDIASYSFNQLYPLYSGTAEFLNKASKKIIIENNAGSQFGLFIRQETGIEFDNKILKYNGMPFSVEEITANIKDILNQDQ